VFEPDDFEEGLDYYDPETAFFPSISKRESKCLKPKELLTHSPKDGGASKVRKGT